MASNQSAEPRQQLSVSARMTLLVYFLDAPFAILIMLGWAALMGLELHAVVEVLLISVAIRWVYIAVHLRVLLGDVDRWRATSKPDVELLRAADRALRRMPAHFTMGFASAWIVGYMLTTAWVYFALPITAPIGDEDLLTTAVLILSTFAGSTSFLFPVANWTLMHEREAMSRMLAEHGVEQPGEPVSIARRFAFAILALVVAPTALLGATAWSNEVAFDRYVLVAELGARLDDDLYRMDVGLPPEHGEVVSHDLLPVVQDNAAIDSLPQTDHFVSLDRRSGVAAVAAPLGDDRWLLVRGSVSHIDRRYATKLLLFCTVLAIYAVALALIMPRSLIAPLRSLEDAMRRLVRAGDIRALGHTPVIEDDEIGTLTRGVNDLVDELRRLADAADAVAAGNLSIEIESGGDLPDAFRAMLAQLQVMVVRIRETAIGVASTASEILATAREQEAAAMRHAERVTDVSGRIASLADVATSITGRATNVLANAEQTLATTDAVLDKIGELNTQASGIADLLEVIREIAERSDLLALNGSLEATRAGEIGRGFALVAAEMRRLAERVTKVVVDVRDGVTAIKSSGSNTLMATTHSRKLAEDTANAARQIFTDTQKQSGDTAHVSASMREMSELVVGVSISTSQTRAATEGLRAQIEELEQVTRQFELARGRGLDNLDR